MNDSKITSRYAKALFDLALETNKLKIVKNDIDVIFKAVSELPNFKEFINSPIIRASKKQEILTNIFKQEVCDISLNFLNLIAHNRREMFLKLICLNFFTLYRKFMNIKQAEITTTRNIPNDFKNKIEEIIKNIYKSEVELEQKIDDSLIGGFIIKIDDKQLDASVSTKLNNIKKELQNSIN